MCDKARDEGWLDDIKTIYPDTLCPETGSPSHRLGGCTAGTGITSICGSAKKIQDCSKADQNTIYRNEGIPDRTYVKLAEYLEEEKDCVGVCYNCPYYMYTDCDRSASTRTCDEVIVDLIKGKYSIDNCL